MFSGLVILSDGQLILAIVAAFSTLFTSLTGLIAAIKSLQQSHRNGQAIQDLHDCIHEQHTAVIAAIETVKVDTNA